MNNFPEHVQNKINELILKYAGKHELALECGGEYIYQSDSAQEDAIELVCSIFESMMEWGGVNGVKNSSCKW